MKLRSKQLVRDSPFLAKNYPTISSLWQGPEFRIGGWNLLNLGGIGQATLTLMMDGPLPDSYYNYGPTLDQPEPHLYEFLSMEQPAPRSWTIESSSTSSTARGAITTFKQMERSTLWAGLYSSARASSFLQSDPGGRVCWDCGFQPGDEVSFLEFDRFDADGSQPIGATSITRLSLAADNQLARLSVELLDEAGIEQNNWLQLRVSGSGIGSFFLLGRADLSQLDGSSALSEVHSRLIFSRVFEGSSAYRGQPATTFLNLVNPGSEPAEMNLTLRSEGGGPSPSGSNSMVTRMLPPKGFSTSRSASYSPLTLQSLGVTSKLK